MWCLVFVVLSLIFWGYLNSVILDIFTVKREYFCTKYNKWGDCLKKDFNFIEYVEK